MLSWVREVTGASSARRGEVLQALWGGYGEIVRVELEGARAPTVVVKRVDPPRARGRSHARKVRSYAVEAAFYRDFAPRTDDACRVPAAYGVTDREGGWRFALEDLDAAGFALRRRRLDLHDVAACLEWLAAFHARFLGVSPDGLWTRGTYWHLTTRPDELAATPPGALRDAAGAIDRALAGCRHRTLVHGDAKAANFCFSRSGAVAAVDFQYVGSGCGVQDVAYLLEGLDERTLERESDGLVDLYFSSLRDRLAGGPHDREEVERRWRALLPMAWADFERFLAGWAPGHAPGRFSRRMIHRALAAVAAG